MKGWVATPIRDEVVVFVHHYHEVTGLSVRRLLHLIGIGRDRFAQWRRRFGMPNRHNASLPRWHWLTDLERAAIVAYEDRHPHEGYRRLTWMMVDEDVVAVSPTSVYRVLKEAGLLQPHEMQPSKKGTGFQQPLIPHEHWHTDICHLNLGGTFYFFLGVIDGASRFIVHWEIREASKTSDVQLVLQRAREKFPQATPRIITDNGPQYVSREFQEFIRWGFMTHVRTSPYYPQSNGKIERFHGSLKRECIRPKTPVSLEDARTVVGRYVDDYNYHRLHSAIGYVTPWDKLQGRDQDIRDTRQRKLAAARQARAAQACIILVSQLDGTTPARYAVSQAGETESGSAGEQPRQGITSRALTERSVGAVELTIPPLPKPFQKCPMPQ